MNPIEGLALGFVGGYFVTMTAFALVLLWSAVDTVYNHLRPQCEGYRIDPFTGLPCRRRGDIKLVLSRSRYELACMNRDYKLCPSCQYEYHDYWDEMWSNVPRY